AVQQQRMGEGLQRALHPLTQLYLWRRFHALSRRGRGRNNDRRYCGSTSMKPTRPGMLPLKKIRFGFVGSMSMRRGSDSAAGNANATDSLVWESKRAIMSTWCWLAQM